MYFPVAGIECNPLLPVGAAFIIAMFTSVAGISGAFLLLPFQMGVLGYTSPSVSATNQLFNIIATPGGIWRFYREKRLLWPLILCMSAGTLPGVFIGALVRATILRQASRFMLFAGLVLAYIGLRLLRNKSQKRKKPQTRGCIILYYSIFGFAFTYDDEVYRIKSSGVIILSLVIGLIGGIYGIGGGGLISPFLVTLFGMPIHAVAGACLFTTFLTSVLGVAFYSLLAAFIHTVPLSPDWLLGLLMGLGGLLGMYMGASLQKYLSPYALAVFLGLLQISIASVFIWRGLL